MCRYSLFNRIKINTVSTTFYISNLTYKELTTMAVPQCKFTMRVSTRWNSLSFFGNAIYRPFTTKTMLLKGTGKTASLPTSHADWYQKSYTSDTEDKKSFLQNSRKQRDLIEGVIRERKDRFQAKTNQIKESGQVLLKDIKKTKDEMKERMEEVIEKENIYTIPNFLTVSRILMSPYLGYLIIHTDYKMALGLFTFAAITDAMDGLIARRYPSQQSKIGSFLDPMADKVMIATLFLSLTYVDLIPVALTGMIITRDLLLVGAGFVIRYRSLPGPKTLSRYFDATHATAQLQPTFISKMNTLIQLALVASTLAAPVFNYVDHQALHVMWYFTALSTAVSALSYIITKNTYRINTKMSK